MCVCVCVTFVLVASVRVPFMGQIDLFKIIRI